MSGERFCSSCGTARVGEATFCTSCGNKFQGGSASGWKFPLIVGAVVLGLSGLAYFSVKMLVPPKTNPGANAVVATEHDHDHTHMDDQRLHALEMTAAQGGPAEVMQLVGYLLEKGATDKHYVHEAADQLEKLLATYPNYAFGLRTLGNIYFDLQMAEKAEAYYRRYLSLYPLDANYRTDLGTVLLSKGQIEEAIDQYKQALGIFPDHYHAAFNLSIAYREKKEPAKSKEYSDLASNIEGRAGKKLAPEIKVPNLPEGTQTVAQKTTAPSAGEGAEATSGSGRYASLESFFRTHEIVGPKMSGFSVKDGVGILLVRQFPMEAMPPFARTAFDTKVKAQLAKVEGGDAALEIRDGDSGALMAEYGPGSP